MMERVLPLQFEGFAGLNPGVSGVPPEPTTGVVPLPVVPEDVGVSTLVVVELGAGSLVATRVVEQRRAIACAFTTGNVRHPRFVLEAHVGVKVQPLRVILCGAKPLIIAGRDQNAIWTRYDVGRPAEPYRPIPSPARRWTPTSNF